MTSFFDRWVAGLFLSVSFGGSQSLPEIESRVRALCEKGAWEDAAELATGVRSRSADLDFYRGLALARLGRFDAAEQAFLEGQRSHNSDPRFALELAGVAYRKQDLRAAKRRLLRALHLDPASNYGNDFLASLFLMENNLPAALKYWNRAGKPLIQDLRFAPVPSLQPLLRERAFAISGGQIFTLERLRATEANLNRLGALASYRFELTPREDQRFDLTFRSIEAATPVGARLSRFLSLLRGLPYQTLYFDLQNLGQRALHVNSLLRWDPDKRRVALSLSGPLRQDPRLRFRWSVDARDEFWDLRNTYFGSAGGLDNLKVRKIETGAEVEIGLSGRLRWTPGLWVARRGFRNDDQARYFTDSWSFQLRNAVAYQLWDLPEYRLRVDTSGLLRTGRVLTGAPSRVVGLEGSLNAIWLPQAKGDDLAVAARLGGGKTFGHPPFDEFFMLGMERDNNLWMRGHAGARDGRKGSAPLGTQYSILQTEVDRTILKFPLIRLQLGPFFDVGRVADASGNFGSRGWMADAGLQAKIRTTGGLTWSFVYGRNLRDGRGVFYTAVSRLSSY